MFLFVKIAQNKTANQVVYYCFQKYDTLENIKYKI